MQSEVENAEADNTRRTYARLAGYLFLGEIILALGSGSVLFHIAGSGSFAERTKRIAASFAVKPEIGTGPASPAAAV